MNTEFKQMDKITFSEAQKMCIGTGHTMWHLKWYPRLESEYPDCSYFICQAGKLYTDSKAHLAVVISNRKAELQHQLREWKKDGRNHPLIEFYEEEIRKEELVICIKKG